LLETFRSWTFVHAREVQWGVQELTQVISRQTDFATMTISGSTAATALSNVANAEGAAPEVAVAMLKKAQDQMKQQGEALIKMIEQTPNGSDGQRLDVYA